MDKKVSGKNLDTYLSLCTEVYELSKPNPPEDAYAFYLEYAKAANGPILEPMCGTGRFLIPLLEEGFDIDGFDASHHMLCKLHEKANAKNLKPNVWHGFIEDFEPKDQYAMIFIASGSMSLLAERKHVLSSLKAMFRALKEGGVLILDVLTPSGDPSMLGQWKTSIWKDHSQNREIVLSTFSSLKDQTLSSVCKYELIENDHVIKTEEENMLLSLYTIQNFTALLSECGFRHIRYIKAFDVTHLPHDSDETVVYECKK